MISIYNESEQPWQFRGHTRSELFALRKNFNEQNRHYDAKRKEKATVGISGYVNSFLDLTILDNALATAFNMTEPTVITTEKTGVTFNHKQFSPIIRPLNRRNARDKAVPIFLAALNINKCRLINVQTFGAELLVYFIDDKEFSFVAGVSSNEENKPSIVVSFYDPKNHQITHYEFTVDAMTCETTMNKISQDASTHEMDTDLINYKYRPELFRPARPTKLILLDAPDRAELLATPLPVNIAHRHFLVEYDHTDSKTFKKTVNKLTDDNYQAVTLFVPDTEAARQRAAKTTVYLKKRFNFVNVLHGNGKTDRVK